MWMIILKIPATYIMYIFCSLLATFVVYLGHITCEVFLGYKHSCTEATKQCMHWSHQYGQSKSYVMNFTLLYCVLSFCCRMQIFTTRGSTRNHPNSLVGISESVQTTYIGLRSRLTSFGTVQNGPIEHIVHH